MKTSKFTTRIRTVPEPVPLPTGKRRCLGWLTCSLAFLLLSLNPLDAASPIVKGDNELDILFPELTLRNGGQMVYDSGRDRVIRYGGTGYREGFPLTSEWDGSNWIPVETAHQPPVQEGFAMAYDAGNGVTVLFGGNPRNADTWLYDGVDWTRAGPDTSPPARRDSALVYDSGRQKIVLFGGSDTDNGLLGDTWEWDGSDWVEIHPAASPDPQQQPRMVYDAARNKTVLFQRDEMWEYNGTTWTDVTPGTMPASNLKGPFVYNPALNRAEFFTGFGGGDFDLWSYNGDAWSSASINSGNFIVSDTSMVYRGNTGEGLIVNLSKIYKWDGTQLRGITPVNISNRSVWADVNGDGYEDRLIAGTLRSPTDSSNRFGKALYLNGPGGLSLTPDWSLRDQVSINAIALGDLTGDGQPDAAFGSAGAEKIQVFANTGGTFGTTPVWESHADYAVNEVVLADVDGDGDLDLTAILSQSDGELLVFLNDGATLPATPSMRFLLPAAPADGEAGFIDHNIFEGSISWADVDYDGQLECAVGFSYRNGGGKYVILLDLNEDVTELTELQLLSGVTAPLALTDVNGDAYPDLIATRPGQGIALCLNSGGSLSLTPDWTAKQYGDDPIDLAIGDFDADGDPDILLGHGSDGLDGIGQTLYRNDGGSFGEYPDWRSKLYANFAGIYRGPVGWTDFNRDGILDVATESGIYLLDSPLRDQMPPLPPRFALATPGPAGSDEVTISWQASVDPDVAAYQVFRGWKDDATAHYLVGTVNGDQTSLTYTHPAGGITQYYVRAVDEAGNVGYWSEAERIGIPYASRTAGDASPDFSIGGRLLIGDVNGDGRPDLVTGHSHRTEIMTDRSWRITSVSAAGVFTTEWTKEWDADVKDPGTPILLADATGDGRADLTVSRFREVDLGGGNSETRLVLEVYPALPSGYGFLTSPTASVILPTEMTSVTMAAWGDANGDNLADLAIAAWGASRKAAVFLSAGNGTQSVPFWTSAANNIEAVAFGNLNSDGRDDLLIAEDVNNGGSSTPIRIHLHNGTAGGPSATADWQDLTPGGGIDGFLTGAVWADVDQNGTEDISVFTRDACFMYRNIGGSLPASESLLVTADTSLDPGRGLKGWANIDGSGALDLYGASTVVLNAGSRSGILNDSNYISTWESDTTHVYRTKAVNSPWRGLKGSSTSFTTLEQVLDLTGNGVAELVTNNGNMIFLGQSGSFPPVLDEDPVDLLVSPASPLLLPEPGATLTLTITAVFASGDPLDITDQVTFYADPMDDGAEAIRMNGNQIVAVQPTVNGSVNIEVEWRGIIRRFAVNVSERPPEPIALRVVPGNTTLTYEGQVLPLRAVATMEGGQEIDVTPETVFNSLNPSVVQVSGSVAIAGVNGTATVTAAYGDLNASATLQTGVSVGITSLSIEPPATSLIAGNTRSYEILVHYADGSSQAVTEFASLSSLNTDVATVSGQTVSALVAGTAQLEASYAGYKAPATVAVTELGPGGVVVEKIRILALQLAGTASPTLLWHATPQIGTTRDFRVMTRTDLVTGDWNPASGFLRGDPTGFMYWEDLVSAESPTRFYLIETQPR